MGCESALRFIDVFLFAFGNYSSHGFSLSNLIRIKCVRQNDKEDLIRNVNAPMNFSLVKFHLFTSRHQ